MKLAHHLRGKDIKSLVPAGSKWGAEKLYPHQLEAIKRAVAYHNNKLSQEELEKFQCSDDEREKTKKGASNTVNSVETLIPNPMAKCIRDHGRGMKEARLDMCCGSGKTAGAFWTAVLCARHTIIITNNWSNCVQFASEILTHTNFAKLFQLKIICTEEEKNSLEGKELQKFARVSPVLHKSVVPTFHNSDRDSITIVRMTIIRDGTHVSDTSRSVRQALFSWTYGCAIIDEADTTCTAGFVDSALRLGIVADDDFSDTEEEQGYPQRKFRLVYDTVFLLSGSCFPSDKSVALWMADVKRIYFCGEDRMTGIVAPINEIAVLADPPDKINQAGLDFLNEIQFKSISDLSLLSTSTMRSIELIVNFHVKFEPDRFVIIYYPHLQHINALVNLFPGAVRIQGASGAAARTVMLQELFQSTDKRIGVFSKCPGLTEGLDCDAIGAVLYPRYDRPGEQRTCQQIRGRLTRNDGRGPKHFYGIASTKTGRASLGKRAKEKDVVTFDQLTQHLKQRLHPNQHGEFNAILQNLRFNKDNVCTAHVTNFLRAEINDFGGFEQGHTALEVPEDDVKKMLTKKKAQKRREQATSGIARLQQQVNGKVSKRQKSTLTAEDERKARDDAQQAYLQKHHKSSATSNKIPAFKVTSTWEKIAEICGCSNAADHNAFVQKANAE